MADDEKVLTLGRIEQVTLDKVRPYWRNPRRVTEEAVNALRSSITEFGYTQPMVVDSEYVLIVGHTRYAALRRMQVETVPVVVADNLTPEQVKQFRLIDNRSGEFTTWNYDALIEEVGDLDSGLLVALFPEVLDMEADDRDQFADAEKLAQQWAQVVQEVEFTCPSCYHEFEVTVTKDAVIRGVIRADQTQEEKTA